MDQKANPTANPQSVLRVAVVQMTSQTSIESNLQELQKVLRSNLTGADLKPQLISLPENALFMRAGDDTIPTLHLHDPRLNGLSQIASEFSLVLHIGSIPIKDEATGKRTNATVIFSPDGKRIVAYQKIHLFDVDVDGHQPVRESDLFRPGTQISIICVNGWKIGLSICYDLRFAELFWKLAQHSVDVILVPSAFLVPTGRAHWEVLLRARAIESQAYLLAAAQSGQHGSGELGRKTYGRSMIVDPWGQIVSEAPTEQSGTSWIMVNLEHTKIEKVRAQIPMEQHRTVDQNTKVQLYDLGSISI